MSIIRQFFLGISLTGLCALCAAAGSDLFRYQGESYGADQASPPLRALIYDLDHRYHEKRKALADELLFELYVEREAAKRNMTEPDFAKELLRYEPAGKDEMRAFYHINQAHIGQPYEEVRDRISQHLNTERLRAAKAEVLEDVKRSAGYKLLIAAPDAPPVEIATEGFPRKGTEAPRVTIVEFGDYQCPHCGKAAHVLSRIVEKYPDDVQVIYMDFPVNRSGISRVVAEGAACAQAQDKFWAYHDLAYGRQAQLNRESPAELAKTLGLDESAFAECLAGDGAKAQVVRAEREARRLGLRATPSIFVNGRPLRSDDLERDLHRLIDENSGSEQS